MVGRARAQCGRTARGAAVRRHRFRDVNEGDATDEHAAVVPLVATEQQPARPIEEEPLRATRAVGPLDLHRRRGPAGDGGRAQHGEAVLVVGVRRLRRGRCGPDQAGVAAFLPDKDQTAVDAKELDPPR